MLLGILLLVSIESIENLILCFLMTRASESLGTLFELVQVRAFFLLSQFVGELEVDVKLALQIHGKLEIRLRNK